VRYFGDYELLEEIARGGMGIVYKARQLSLNRLVALKTLPPAFALDPYRLQRFRNEAAIAARLSDSRILEVHDVLEADGIPVLVMPYMDGPDLHKIIKFRTQTRVTEGDATQASRTQPGDRSYLDAVLPFLDQLVDAVAVLHEAGVVHRDIKPSNVLIDLKGNVRLSDLGLARLGEGADLTRPGSELGTPGYMAPEQYEGQSKPDARVDVFGLGATIYCALTLALPYGRQRITPRIPLPKPPSARQRLLTADDDAVLLKALEPGRNDRYASALEFREDWRRIRHGLIPRVRRIGPIRRLGRMLRRHPIGSAYATVLASVMTLALASWSFMPVSPDAPRWVRIRSDRPIRRFAIVPLDRQTGQPRASETVTLDGGLASEVDLKARPGDYLIEMEWPDRPFHEVYRHVPRPEEEAHPGMYGHNSWKKRGNSLDLPRIKAPRLDVLTEMVRFSGALEYQIPTGPSLPKSGRTVAVAPFWLDRTEVTVGAFREVNGGRPPRTMTAAMGPPSPAIDRLAISNLDHDQAIAYAERLGKRLPDISEYLFAARNGGAQTRYPWGSQPPPNCREPWTLGPVGGYTLDRLMSDPSVVGLYSNVAEWTSTWQPVEAPPPPGTTSPPQFVRRRMVCGAPVSILDGNLKDRIKDPDCSGGTAERATIDQATILGGAGIRGTRSDRPRFLGRSR
jgi:serine/threonine protein kinase/formylglycine-generating enzyme required for sulfatase activity